MLKALAWDDNPAEYFEDLKIHFYDIGIDMELIKDFNNMPARIDQGGWDLVVLDILDEVTTAVEEGEPRGIRLCRMAHDKNYPVYVITNTPNYPQLQELPFDIPIISKLTPTGFAAYDIKRDLERRGRWVDRKKVFLIYGHDRKAEDASATVRGWLRSWGLDVGTIAGPDLSKGIVLDLFTQIQESAAVVAVCTPDDVIGSKKDDKYAQPRQNVLLEIGMAMGLAGGLHKLTFLQKTHPDDLDLHARLPTDLGGVLTFSFKNTVEEVEVKLKSRLVNLGVGVTR